MYFIPRNNKVYSFLITAPQYMWYIFTLTIFLFIGASWWTVWYIPAQRELAHMRAECDALVQQQLAMDKVNKQIDQLKGVVDNLKATIKQNLAEYHQHKLTINTIIINAVDQGLSLHQCKSIGIEKKDWLVTRKFELQLSGSFDVIERFFKTLALHDYPLSIEQLTLSKNKKDTLDVRCIVTLIEVLHDIQGLS